VSIRNCQIFEGKGQILGGKAQFFERACRDGDANISRFRGPQAFPVLRDLAQFLGGEDYVIKARLESRRILKEHLERAAEGAVAPYKESQGVGVAVDGAAIGNPMSCGDLRGALEAEESGLDGLALRVSAHSALSPIAAECRAESSPGL
jgi:hypothetical protein